MEQELCAKATCTELVGKGSGHFTTRCKYEKYTEIKTGGRVFLQRERESKSSSSNIFIGTKQSPSKKAPSSSAFFFMLGVFCCWGFFLFNIKKLRKK